MSESIINIQKSFQVQTLKYWTFQIFYSKLFKLFTLFKVLFLFSRPAYEDFASKDFLENDPNYLLELLSQIRAQMPHHNMDM